MNHWFLIILLFALYILPTLIAFIRGHRSRYAIVMLNVLFGWSVLAWLIALIWSCANKGENVTIINNVGNSNAHNA